MSGCSQKVMNPRGWLKEGFAQVSSASSKQSGNAVPRSIHSLNKAFSEWHTVVKELSCFTPPYVTVLLVCIIFLRMYCNQPTRCVSSGREGPVYKFVPQGMKTWAMACYIL